MKLRHKKMARCVPRVITFFTGRTASQVNWRAVRTVMQWRKKFKGVR
jgi:hypothetical protein